jgi:hypothetical protein
MTFNPYPKSFANEQGGLNLSKYRRVGDELPEMLDFMEQNRLYLNPVFVPFSQSRNRDQKYHALNWRCQLIQNQREVFTFDYSAGTGHIPGSAQGLGRPSRDTARHIREICEYGRWKVPSHVSPSMGWLSDSKIKRWSGHLIPAVTDVMYSLSIDSDVLNYSSFEDWASCFGYDEDSRSAESIYRQCLETALALRAAVGDSGMARLAEIFQDY